MLNLGISSEQPSSLTAFSSPQTQPRTIRPIAVYALNGLAAWQGQLLALDSLRGYLVRLDPASDNTIVLNAHSTEPFVDATGLAIWGETIWFTQGNNVYFCGLDDLTPQLFTTLPYTADAVGVWESTIYVTCQKAGYIFIYERSTQRRITQFPLPGVGIANLTVRDEELWVCDRTEQTVYCLDRATGTLQFSILTPFECPTGLAFLPEATGEQALYVSYASEEAYIRDNPNADPSHELTFRDRTFVHPLYFHNDPKERYALSNGYLIEMSYVEELLPLDEVHLENLEWRIALPTETDRQKVRQVEAIGMPFTEEIQEGQKVAVFKFDSLKPHERHIFGWKALLEVRAIKYQLTPDDFNHIPELSPEFKARYLIDDDELAMDTPTIQAAAREAIGTETNILRKILKIRNFVYDRLSYGIKPHIDSPDVVLERGIGSCGEYVGLLLALARLNGIACRTVGRYKCPPYPERQRIPLEPDYNHVWIEFYVPSFGWLPMESNPDDVVERGPYPTRFFMGLPWFHAEIGKGVTFESLRSGGVPVGDLFDLSIGDLAINHIRFTILEELPPI
ncbi:transglutaminase family protein [Phormidesmis priestleyi ULC007]|uniref:Transglutaminase family protein n=1 Tax=Phormidesmis priestleyi ULC007 TaxID=1920490 RepID=A0A2T1DIJ5_9CYAN|nr:transglutaminase family protein [Phormidesmis priestleyi]PSB20293.1 transglutaminase family protein [Phormidesmis priestleyi ULC007]PZO50162.1 MAG: transglutaminase family protein [Phormidesmis priestleyi]